MIDQECIDELADAIGIKAEVAAITARAMNGELDFEARAAHPRRPAQGPRPSSRWRKSAASASPSPPAAARWSRP